MTEERVDIVITDKVSEEPARKIKFIAEQARNAHDALAKLRAELTNINASSVRKLQQEMTRSTIETTRQAAAFERLQAAQLRTQAAVARLEKAQNLANNAAAQGALMQQRLVTETARTDRAMQAAVLTAEKLRQARDRSTAAIEREGDAMVKMFNQVTKAQAQHRAAQAQQGWSEIAGIGMGSNKSARASMAVFQQDAADKALAAKETANLEKRTIALRSAIDPAYAAQMRFNQVQAEANTLLARGSLTQTEHARVMAMATTALNQHTGAQQNAAKAVGLTRFQMLTLQYTVNDVVASLASGANPLTILLQQGGQVTQAWGGLGNTMRAAAGVVLTVKGAMLGLATVVAGGLAVWDMANAKFAGVQRQLDLTQGSAGYTAGSFTVMAEKVAEASKVSVSAATDVAMAYAGSGRLQKQQVEALTRATVNFAKLTGESTEKIVKDWTRMADQPSRFVREFTMQYGVFTAAQHEHIQLLEDTGRKTEALNEVTRKLYDYYGKEAPANLGYLASGWNIVTSAISNAWNAVMKFGRDMSVAEQFEETKTAVAKLQKLTADERPLVAAAAKRELADAKLKLGNLQRSVELEERNARLKAEQTASEKAAISASERVDAYTASIADNATKAKQEIEKFRRDLEAMGKVNPQGAKYLDALKRQNEIEAGITRKHMPAATKAARDLRKEEERLEIALERIFGTLNKEVAGLGVLRGEREKMNKLAEIEIALAAKKFALNAQQREDVADMIDAVENQRVQQQALDRVYEDATGPMQTYQANQRAITALLNAEIISLAEATRQANLNTEAMLNATDPYRSINKGLKEQAKLMNLVGEEREFASRMLQYENELQSKGIDLNAASQASERARLEGEVRGAMSRERVMKNVNQYYDASIGAAAELAAKTDALTIAFASGYIGLDAYRYGLIGIQAELANLRLAAGNGTFDDQLLVSFERNLSAMEDALVDFTMTGKLNVKSMVTSMIADFMRMGVVRPLMSGLLGEIGIGSGSVVGNAAQAGGGGLMGLLNTGSSVYNWGSKALNWLGIGGGGAAAVGAGGLGLTASLGTGTTLASAGGGLGLTAGGGLGLTGTFGGTLGTSAAVTSGVAGAGTGAASGGIMAGLANIPGWGWAAMGALTLLGMGGKKGGPKTEIGYGYGINGINNRDWNDSGAKDMAQGIEKSYRDVAKALKLESELRAGVFVSKDEKGDSLTQLQVAGAVNGKEVYARTNEGSIENVGRSDEALAEAFALSSLKLIVAGLQADSGLGADYKARLSSVPGDASAEALQEAVDEIVAVKSLRDALKMLPFKELRELSYAASVNLIKFSGGIDALNSNLNAYYENFYSDEEKLATIRAGLSQQFAELNLTMPETRDGFRQLVEAQDLTTEAGQRTYASLLGLSGAYAEMTDAMVDAAASAADAIKDRQKLAMDEVERTFGVLKRMVQQEKDRMKSELDAAMDALNARQKDYEDRVRKTKETADLLANTLKQFDTDAVLGMSRDTAISQLDEALLAARGGVLPTADSLRDALGVVTQPSADLFGSFVEYARDFDAQAAKVRELNDIAQTQLSTEEETLAMIRSQKDILQATYDAEVARLDQLVDDGQRQIDILNGVYVGIVNIPAAVTAMGNAIAAAVAAGAGSPAPTPSPNPSLGGIYSNPDGSATAFFPGGGSHQVQGAGAYAILQATYPNLPAYATGGWHPGGWALVGERGPELIRTSGATDILNNYATERAFSSPGQIDTQGMINAINNFAYEQATANYEIIATLKSMYRLLETWNENGMPDVDPDWADEEVAA